MANDGNGLDALSGIFLGEITGATESEQTEETSVAAEESATASEEQPGEIDEIDALAEIDEDGDDAGDAAGQAEPEGPKKYKVKVDGDDVEVDEDELKSGYSRMSDYTRKTTKLAEERKAFEAEQSELRRERELYSQILGNWESGLESVLKEFVPADLNELRSYDPEQYITVNEKLQRHQQTLDNIKSERSRIQGENDKAQKEQFGEYLKKESEKLYEQIPEWKDEAVRRKEVGAVTDYAKKTFGFTDDDINSSYNHALWVAMRESMKYRQIVEKRKQLKPDVKVKTAEPGATSVPATKAKRMDAIAQNLKKTGNVKDYAAFLLQQMQD